MPTSNTTIIAPRATTGPHTKLSGRPLLIMRIVWGVITLLTLLLVITAIPLRFEKVRAGDPNLQHNQYRALIEAGVAPEIAAALDVGTGILLFVMNFSAAIVLFWRRSDSRVAIILSLGIILVAANFANFLALHRTTDAPLSQPLPGLLVTLLIFVEVACALISLYWLPDGQFIPHWSRFLVMFALVAIAFILLTLKFPEGPIAGDALILAPALLVGMLSQIYRYRYVASLHQRQQIKWVTVGLFIAIIGYLFFFAATLLAGNQVSVFWLATGVVARIVLTITMAAGLIAIGIAVLRYRLWDVDLTLNRSLVYGIVTLLLVIVFLSGAFILQSIVGQSNAGIAFALAVFAAGLLFNPARKRAQHLVDRRFYRFRFDLNELAAGQKAPNIKNPGILTGHRVGPYQVMGVVGRGGMGEVYQGQDNDRMVALKILPPDLAQQESFRKRFEREAESLTTFDHPNIVKIFDYGQSDGVYYMAMEFVVGDELSKVIHQRERIPLADLKRFVHDFAAALDYAHARGLVHRDIKPSNIMMRLKPDGQTTEAVLMDFGIAKIKDAHTELTGAGVVGTIDYMAPEQIAAAREVDHRADIYALGVVLYEMITGEPPFKGSPAQVLFAHMQQPPPDPRDLVPDLPERTTLAILRALAKKPEDRFQSAGELAAALVG